MYDPVIYHLRRTYPAAAIRQPSLPKMAGLRCANGQQFLSDRGFDLAYCYHDGADTFISALEIHARHPLTFPVECPYFDLHGCYVVEGNLRMRDADNRELVITAGHYAFLYAPMAEYEVTFSTGITVLQLWSTNDRVLLRERSHGALKPLGTLLDQWATGAQHCHHSRVLPYSQACKKIWSRLMALPRLRPLTLDIRLRQAVADLIYCCVDRLLERRQAGHPALRRLHDFRLKAVEKVRAGEAPKVLELASEIGVSDSYLRRLYRQYYGVSPQAFLMVLRLRKAREMLLTHRYTLTHIAYATGFTSLQDFSRQYKKRYQHTPHSAQR